MRVKRFALLLLLVLALGGVVYYWYPMEPSSPPDRDGTKPEKEKKRPDYELRVSTVSGDVRARTPRSDTRWEHLQSGDVLPEGTEVRAADESSLEMVVPERAYFQFADGSLAVDELETDTFLRTTGDTPRTIESNELSLSMSQGEIKNTVKNDTRRSNDYTIETPSAVMGIRGTTYGCETTEAGSTSCAVLEGEVNFSDREDTTQSVALSAGQTSSIDPEDTEPSRPRVIDRDRKRDLETVQTKATQQLRRRPFVHSLKVNDQSLYRRMSVTYRGDTPLRLSGRADTRGVAGLKSVHLEFDDRDISVRGDSSWVTSIEPDAPEVGTKRRVSVVVRASTVNGQVSFPYRFTLILRNPLEIPPPGYRTRRMNFNLEAINGFDRRVYELPFILYRDDTVNGRVPLSGSLQIPEGNLSGLAYRVGTSGSWRTLPVNQDWAVRVNPGDSRTWSIDFVAWTDQRTRSQVETIGPFRMAPDGYESAVRQSFKALWDAFGHQRWSDVMAEFSEGFEFVHPDEQTLGGDSFRDVLSRMGREFETVSVKPHIESVSTSPGSAQLKARLNWEGRWTEDYEGPLGFPPIMNGYETTGTFTYVREADGVFRLTDLAGRSPKKEAEPSRTQEPKEIAGSVPLRIGQRTSLVMNHRNAINLRTLSVVENEKNPAAQRQEGHLVAGVDPVPFEWSGGPPKLYVNDGSHTFCTGYYCYDYPVQAGGIRRAEATSLDAISSFPALVEGQYQSRIEVTNGGLYFVHVRTNQNDVRKAILKIDDVSGGSSGSARVGLTLYEVR